jgi:hypothetical protein
VASLRTALVSLVVFGSAASVNAQSDPFARHAWTLELAVNGLSEAWNYNESREELYGVRCGLTYALREGLMLHIGPTVWYASQRNADAFIVGASGGVRWAVWRGSSRAISLDLGIGGSRAETPVPPRGTRFNYIFQVGTTYTHRLSDRVVAEAALTWLHLSNNSLAGRGRNPDVQAVGLQLGVLIPF